MSQIVIRIEQIGNWQNESEKKEKEKQNQYGIVFHI